MSSATNHTNQIPDPVWITDEDGLAAQCKEWLAAEFLSVDTEFVRTTTFFPKPGLVQVADSQRCYLIDPLEIGDWSSFAEVLEAPGVIKVFHACAEDLEVCRQLAGVLPQPLFDTQLAMAFAGFGGSVGFQRAVAVLLEIDIPKEATRTDWLQRPLTAVQLEYATADVFYLHKIYPMLLGKLQVNGRLGWLQEECQRIIDQAEGADDYSLAYQRVKLGWKLRSQEQCILQALASWREIEARRRDVPRNKIADDQALWNIARFKARNRDQLIKAGLKPHIVRDEGKVVLQLVADSLEKDETQWPERLNKPLSIEEGNNFKKLRKIANQKAEELDMPPELVANKRILDALIRSRGRNIPDALAGWRMTEIGQNLVAKLNELSGNTDD
ncbi:MAG: ribonuclease D [Thalassolituus sp.]